MTALAFLLLAACGPSDFNQAKTLPQVQTLIADGKLQGREELLLRDLGLGADLAKSIAASPDSASLKVLDLRGNGIGPHGAAALAESENLGALQALYLPPGKSHIEGNRIGDDGAQALLASTALSSLEILDLTQNDLGPQSLLTLAKGGLPELNTLILDSNALGDEGAAYLGAQGDRDVQRLQLGWNGVGDLGAVALANGPLLKNAEVLLLSSNEIGAAGAMALASGTSLRELDALYLSGNKVGEAGEAMLKARFGEALKLDGGEMTVE
ncbi:MAG: Ran GTPase-activating protein (RanGAP) involved in mRNA processing and transport [Cognaticolwellia sp.]|jgi:Ran GTPase-activating protein (RanGAP) involved in mRNA processing and transport